VPRFDDTLDPARVAVELFGEGSANGLERLFAGADLEPRVRLACLLLSGGDVAGLRHFIAQAKADSRDVLYWAFEYDDQAPAALRRYLRR